MNFQLLNIAVYNASGERREIEFKLGCVNIVTGGSGSGKTALIDIVDYCLGRLECEVPVGVIRDTVVWYVIRIQTDDKQIIIGRPSPPEGQQSISDVFLEVGADLELPELPALEKTTTTKALRSFLTETVGITANEHVPPKGQSRNPLTATFGHTCFYLFQPQDYIAKRNILFYRQDEPFVPQSITDTLPFLMGVVGDEQYEKVQELRRLRRTVRLLERRIADEEAIQGHDNSRGVALYAEAQQVELIAAGDPPDDSEEVAEVLAGLLQWEPTTPAYSGADPLADLQNRREQLRSQAWNTEREIDAAKAFALRQEGFSHEVVEQSVRLKSIGLYKKDGGGAHSCPLCNGELDETIPSASAILHSLANIEKQMDTVARQRPRLDAYITEREEYLSQTKRLLEENRNAIESVVAQQDALRQQRNRQASQSRVIGRISLFLDSLAESDEDSDDLHERLSKAQNEAEKLEAELSDEAAEDRLEAALRLIGEQMSAAAKKLKLEFSEFPLSLDISKLTVVAYREMGKVRLLDMGSAENWMGYHLVTHFALHKWFVENNRPVPRFLMLDQPTQVYFPKDPPKTGELKELKDEDRQKVRKLFKFIFDATKALNPNFQVIITDHADIDVKWFQDAVVQRWWGGEKLIPKTWIRKAKRNS